MKKTILLSAIMFIIAIFMVNAVGFDDGFLEAYYSFDNLTGAVLVDEAQLLHNGSVFGTTLNTTDCILNNCYDLRGSPDTISIADNSGLHFSGNFTVSFWTFAGISINSADRVMQYGKISIEPQIPLPKSNKKVLYFGGFILTILIIAAVVIIGVRWF